MEIRVLGCYGGEMPGHKTTCFMVNENVVIDAGALTGSLAIEDQEKVDSIILTHSHIDHIRDIPFLADNIFGKKDRPVMIHGLPETIENLREHILNFSVWPDFTVLPDPDNPIVAYHELEEGAETEIEELTITPIKVNHTVPTAGYIVQNGDRSFAFSGDTGPTEKLWEAVREIKSMTTLFIEVSFPNRLASLAAASGHLTPEMAVKELEKIQRPDLKIYVQHMKPQYLTEIVKEIESCDANLKVIRQEDRIEI